MLVGCSKQPRLQQWSPHGLTRLPVRIYLCMRVRLNMCASIRVCVCVEGGGSPRCCLKCVLVSILFTEIWFPCTSAALQSLMQSVLMQSVLCKVCTAERRFWVFLWARAESVFSKWAVIKVVSRGREFHCNPMGRDAFYLATSALPARRPGWEFRNTEIVLG